MARRRGYKFTNKVHSPKAVMSAVFGILSCVSLAAVVYLSYTKGGQVPVNYGIAGILILLFAIVGMILAIYAVRERDHYKIFAYLGLLFNFAALACMSGVLYAGSYL